MDERVTFRETQRFRQPWLWVLIGGVGVVSLVAGAGIGVVIAAGVAALFAVARLTTEVREDGVYVRFAPFHRSFRRIGFEEIERHGLREFGVLTYGGIGIRWTPSTIAYTTAGKEWKSTGRTGKPSSSGHSRPTGLRPRSTGRSSRRPSASSTWWENAGV